MKMEADNKLFDIWKKFDFNIDPINSESEKKKFLKNKDYNPKFKYNQNQDLDQFKKNLENLSPDRSWIGKMIKERANFILKEVEMLKNPNSEVLTNNSLSLFGKPDMNLLNFAYGEAKLPDEFEIKNLSDRDARRAIIRSIKELKLERWKVNIREDMSAIAKVNTSSRHVFIKQSEKFSTSGVERLIVHELQTHAFRMENSLKQKYKLFQVGFPRYLETEEGLASFNEEKIDYLLHNKIRRTYSGRVIAVHLALDKSFADVYEHMNKYFDEEDSWNMTVRAKRGLLDTSEVGAFTKDMVYLNGIFKLKEFLRKNSEEKYTDLYIGRIGIDHVEELKQNLKGELVKPIFLPKL